MVEQMASRTGIQKCKQAWQCSCTKWDDQQTQGKPPTQEDHNSYCCVYSGLQTSPIAHIDQAKSHAGLKLCEHIPMDWRTQGHFCDGWDEGQTPGRYSDTMWPRGEEASCHSSQGRSHFGGECQDVMILSKTCLLCHNVMTFNKTCLLPGVIWLQGGDTFGMLRLKSWDMEVACTVTAVNVRGLASICASAEETTNKIWSLELCIFLHD